MTVADFVGWRSTRWPGLDALRTLDERYLRPTEVASLIGDPSKAMTHLGWKAETGTEPLAQLMVDADIAALAEKTSRPESA